MNRDQILAEIAKSECKLLATNEYGELKVIAFGTRADMEAIAKRCKAETNPQIIG